MLREGNFSKVDSPSAKLGFPRLFDAVHFISFCKQLLYVRDMYSLLASAVPKTI